MFVIDDLSQAANGNLILSYGNDIPLDIQDNFNSLISRLGFKVIKNAGVIRVIELNLSRFMGRLVETLTSKPVEWPVETYKNIILFLRDNKLYNSVDVINNKKLPQYLKLSFGNDLKFYLFTGESVMASQMNDMLWHCYNGQDVSNMPTMNEFLNFKTNKSNKPYRRGKGSTADGYKIFEVMSKYGRYVILLNSINDYESVNKSYEWNCLAEWVMFQSRLHIGFYIKSKKDALNLVKDLQAKKNKD